MVQFGFLSAYGLFDLYMYFKKGDVNGHQKIESMAKITFWINKLAAAAILDFFKVPVVLFVRHLVMLESFKIFDNFKTLIRNRPI